MQGLLADPSHNVEDVDAAYLAEHVWITGSPETVTQKINDWQGSTCGFGTMLIYSHDYLDDSKLWDEFMRRLAQQVAPKITVPS